MQGTPTHERREQTIFNCLRRAYIRRRYRMHLDAWGIGIGLLAIWQFVMYLAWPEVAEVSSVSQIMGVTWGYLWALAYAVAGSCMVYGLVKPDSGADAFGLVVLAAATAGQIVCIIIILPERYAASLASLTVPMVAAIMRYRVVTGRVRRVPDDIPPWP